MTSSLPLIAAVLSPDARPGLQPEDVTPGVIGFLVTLALVVVTIGLIRSMTRKMRGVSVRADAALVSDAAPSDAAPGVDGPGSGRLTGVAGSPDQPDEGPVGEGESDGAHPVA